MLLNILLSSPLFNFFKFIYFCVIFWLCWVFIVVHRISLLAVCRLLIAVASLAAEHRLLSLQASVVGSSLTKDGTWIPHWITREVPSLDF